MYTQNEYNAIINRLDQLTKLVENTHQPSFLGEWVDQKTAMRITSLSRSKLYELRKANKITTSTIAGKGVFYKISDFQRLLDENEGR